MKAYEWLLAGISLASWIGATNAAPPDFSICDGQAGVGLGLCRGGIAAGCDGANGGTEACLAIEANYRQISGGNEPPWIDSGYPVNTISLEIPYGIDLESGEVTYDASHVLIANPSHPACQTTGTCGATDLTVDVWREMAGDSGNPFYFFQDRCTAPDEPGYGGVPEYVLLRSVPFAEVRNSTIDSVVFSQAPFNGGWWGPLPNLGSNDTLIVHTCAGNYFKVGNQKCNYPDAAGSEWPMCKEPDLPVYWTQFDYQMLRPVP